MISSTPRAVDVVGPARAGNTPVASSQVLSVFSWTRPKTALAQALPVWTWPTTVSVVPGPVTSGHVDLPVPALAVVPSSSTRHLRLTRQAALTFSSSPCCLRHHADLLMLPLAAPFSFASPPSASSGAPGSNAHAHRIDLFWREVPGHLSAIIA